MGADGERLLLQQEILLPRQLRADGELLLLWQKEEILLLQQLRAVGGLLQLRGVTLVQPPPQPRKQSKKRSKRRLSTRQK